MELRSMAKSLAVFLVGSTGIPTVAASLVPVSFVKGHLQIPFWDGIAILAIALAAISTVSAALYLACLEIEKVVPPLRISACIGFLSTALAYAIFFQSGNLLFFFLVHFGCAIGAGLLLRGPERRVVP